MNKESLENAIRGVVHQIQQSIQTGSEQYLLCELHSLKSLLGFANLFDLENIIHTIEKSILKSGLTNSDISKNEIIEALDKIDFSKIELKLSDDRSKPDEVHISLTRPKLSLEEYASAGHQAASQAYIVTVIIDPEESFPDSRVRLLVRRIEESLFVMKSWVYRQTDSSGLDRIVLRLIVKTTNGELKIRKALSTNGVLAVLTSPYRLSLGKQEENIVREERISNFLSEYAHSLSNRLNKEIRWTGVVELQEIGPSFESSLQTIFIQAIRNSLRHGIETTKERLEKGKDRIGKLSFIALIEPEYLYFELLDDGIGYETKLIMDELSQQEPEGDVHGGHGIGLSVIEREVTNILGGQFGIHDAIGGGTKFWVRIPRSIKFISSQIFSYENAFFACGEREIIGYLEIEKKLIDTEKNMVQIAGLWVKILPIHTYLSVNSIIESAWMNEAISFCIMGTSSKLAFALPISKKSNIEDLVQIGQDQSVYSKLLDVYIPLITIADFE